MKLELKLKKLLRQNKPHHDGTPGSYSIRLFVQEAESLKAKRIEVGLGTNNEAEALKRAESIVRAFYAAGGRFTHKVGFCTQQKRVVSVTKAAEAINKLDTLPLWHWKVYPHRDELQD